MKKLLTLLTAVMITGCANQVPYFKVGAGYKVSETEHQYCTNSHSNGFMTVSTNCVTGNNPISARIQLGVEDGNFRYGIDHHSQWMQGAPVNDDSEYQKTEIFVDYVFKWND